MEKRIKDIAHPGIVESTAPQQVNVRIEPQSACGTCHSKSYCSMAESSGKLVEVSVNDSSPYQPGQQVTLFLQESLGYRALWLGYILPFLVLLAVLVSMVVLTANEGLSALVSVLAISLYYIILYHKRHLLKKTFAFRIR